MAMTAEDKATVVKDFQQKPGDTGSAEVQVALLSARINDLSSHFQDHTHDHHSRVGLLRMVDKRRKLLEYLKNEDINRYRTLIDRLGLRK
ncbi:MAG: 30S ribosomal protein S15 [Gammaproteobacteria bacterium]|nr:MAG: 30S ribosomal protein S15 [Gammaproteobacteria bacterium]